MLFINKPAGFCQQENNCRAKDHGARKRAQAERLLDSATHLRLKIEKNKESYS